MFVDASAMVAILTGEADGPALIAAIDGASGLITSPIAIWETVVRLMSKTTLSESEASGTVQQFLAASGIATIAIGADEAARATSAYARYGKRRHPADLNMGDCFAYACAKAHGVALLYIGNDFGETDVNEGFG